MARVHKCPHIEPDGTTCPNLAPCPRHSRPRSAHWSKDRDRGAQMRFRAAVLARDGCCVMCGATEDLQAHHLVPGDDDIANGRTLCRTCHRATDTHAR